MFMLPHRSTTGFHSSYKCTKALPVQCFGITFLKKTLAKISAYTFSASSSCVPKITDPIAMKNERLRLKAMRRYLNKFPEAEGKLQDIVELASQLTGVPVAFITLLDKEVQWITVKHGYPVEQMPRVTSFCTHTIAQEEVMVVRDASQDERFTTNPLVVYPPSVRYYAGVSLKSADGHNVGTLCVMDVESHDLSAEQLNALKALSRQVTTIMELTISIDHLRKSVKQIEVRNKALKKIAQVQSHEIRGPLTSVMGVMNLIVEENLPGNKEYIDHLATAIKQLDDKIRSIVQISSHAANQ
jgi:K+-sensing histidine kinase KdpD